ncbi:MAG: S8 family serine peptidase [Sedimentibacter sp.]
MIVKNFLIATICLMLSNNIQASSIPVEKGIDNSDHTIVAVIDSKINTEHEYITNNCLDGKSFIIEESNTKGHGTAVAGAVVKYSSITAEALGKESNVSILPIEINVIDIQRDYGDLLSQSIQYAVDEGADVINMSFSSAVANINVYEKIRYGLENGVVFVSAAGNSGLDSYSFPAAYEGVISVGSSTSTNDGYTRSSFSNCNDDVDLLFDGEKMILPDNMGYSEKTGTSYSVGAISGIIGEFISIYPEINPEHIVYALYDTAISVDGKGTGYGIVDIIKANYYLKELNENGVSPLTNKDPTGIEAEKLILPKLNEFSAGRSLIAYVENENIKIYDKTKLNSAGTSKWKNVIKLYAGRDNTAAINSSNVPMAAGYNVFNKNILRGWIDIKELSLSSNFTAGLTYGGNVYVTDYLKTIEGDDLTDVVQISSGAHHVAAVTKSGKVLTKGYNLYNQMDTDEWRNIIYSSSNTRNTAAIDKNGNAFVAGDNLYGQRNVSKWKDIVSIKVGDGFIIGLKKDGTVTATGRNIYDVCETDDLKNIKFIDASETYFIAIDDQNNIYIKGRMKQ